MKVYRSVDVDTTIIFKFKCPYCERTWAFDNKTKYCKEEFEVLSNGDALMLDCQCGEKFIAKGKLVSIEERVEKSQGA